MEAAQKERAIADARRKEQELRIQAAEAAKAAGEPETTMFSNTVGLLMSYSSGGHAPQGEGAAPPGRRSRQGRR